MQVQAKIYMDGQTKPIVTGEFKLHAVLEKYVHPSQHVAVMQDVKCNGRVEHRNRWHGCKVVLRDPARKATVNRDRYKPLRVTLDGIVTQPQIKVAAVEALKGEGGWHRTVVEVVANGMLYKVKCYHKGVTYAECLDRCKIETIRAL